MDIDKKKVFGFVKINLPVWILFGLLIISIIVGYIFFCVDYGVKVSSILASLLVGLIIVIIQFLFSWAEYKTIAKIKTLGVKSILSNREEREFYQKLIENSNNSIKVMGVTASRFMQDFADKDGHNNAKVLIMALSRGVEVKILVPKQKYLQKRDEQKANIAKDYFKKMSNEYQNFEYRYFDHEPAHSIFWVDDECILGPVFPEVKSKYTPAVYIDANSGFADKYKEYFENEWMLANEND